MNITTVIVMACFLLLLAGVGVYSKRFVVEADDFLLAGRELGSAILVFGVVASGFAGTTLTLAPGLGIRLLSAASGPRLQTDKWPSMVGLPSDYIPVPALPLIAEQVIKLL